MTAASGDPSQPRTRLIKQLSAVGLTGLVAITILSYVLRWSWTGFSGNGTVWDWLNLFLLPIAVALVPVVFESSTRAVVTILVSLCVPLAVLLIGGYGFNWRWTGFEGNTLWDWLHLLLVPAAIPLAVRGASNAKQTRTRSGGATSTPGGGTATAFDPPAEGARSPGAGAPHPSPPLPAPSPTRR